MSVRVGTDSKGDCLVEIAAAEVPDLNVSTKNAGLLEAGLRNVCRTWLEHLNTENEAVTVADFGAVDYVIRARLETAARMARPQATSRLVEMPSREMSERDRPRRSRLYVPGNNPRLLSGIEVHGADCVLLDLEDSVPPDGKLAARILVKHLLASIRFSEEVWVRINPLDAGGIEDLEDILQGQPHGVCLPKAESADDVRRLVAELARIEADLGFAERRTWVMPILETARGILRAEEIAVADERVVIMAFGAEDFTRDVGARRTDTALLHARAQIVLAAKAAGVQASDTVFADLGDMEGLAAESADARGLGFDGKGAINPRQIATIHRAFSPTEEELAAAREVVAAAREAETRGLGAVSLNGRMIDQPVLERARRLITYASKLSQGGRS